MESVIQVKSLSKKYRLGVATGGFSTLRDKLGDILSSRGPKKNKIEEFWALKEVSFEVHAGEVLGIIGANGAGKSTLLKVLSRITEPTEGEVIISGRCASLLEVGTGFHPELSGRENIFLNGVILGMKRGEVQQQFDQIVDFAGVERFLDTPVKRYSSGMFVRLAFAVAAHLNPHILIVDEVLAVGDAEFQRRCLGKMGEVARSGRTVLFVSHNMQAIEELCSRVILMSRGRVLAEGTPHQMVRKHLERSHEGDTSVTSLTDRASGIVLKSVYISGQGTEQSGFATCGDKLTIELKFLLPRAEVDLSLHLGIYTEDSILLCLLDSELAGVHFSREKGAVVATCEIPSLPLLPGRYSINIALLSAGRVLAGFTEGASFEVRTSDEGRVRLPPRGLIQLKAEWGSDRT